MQLLNSVVAASVSLACWEGRSGHPAVPVACGPFDDAVCEEGRWLGGLVPSFSGNEGKAKGCVKLKTP
jgi:hypothetical protein